MTSVLVKHKVESYEKWKKVFDSFVDTRKKGGEKSFEIYSPIDDPNNLIVLFSWESKETAETFLASSDLKEAMQEAGVTEHPEIFIMNKIDQGVM